MDFVVSKVVMSICALMVVTILGGMFSASSLFDSSNELRRVLTGLCSIADELSLSMGASGVGWRVPFTSSGDMIRITIDHSIIRAEGGPERAVDQPACDIHTWVYGGETLNTTKVVSLDDQARTLEARSGTTIYLSSEFVTVDNENRLFVFARAVA